MSDLDEIFQNQLEAIESGKPLEKVLEEMPAEESELAPLLRLASAVRTVAHPAPQKDGVLTYVQNAATRRNHNHRPSPRLTFNRPWMRPAFATVAVLCAVVILLAAGMWLVGPRNANAATLMDVAGQVEVAANDSATSWKPVSEGDQVHSGERIRTGGSASVTLVFFEGSRATLGANTDVTLADLNGTRDRSLHLVLDQRAGKTSHSVVPLKGTESAYLVQTPSGTASVHGTVFSVAVDKNGQARFAVDSGKVQVSSQGSEVVLAAGQATAAEPSGLTQAPGYQFQLNGQVESIVGDVWTVSSVPFEVVTTTEISGSPVVGSFVDVEGRITARGWIADSIEVTEPGREKLEFTGILESNQGNVWKVSGKDLQITSETEYDSSLVVGDLVKVKYYVSGQTWVAVSIEKLEEEEPTEPPVATEPITATETVTATRAITDCTGANPHPQGVKLSARYHVSYDVIMSWFCKGFGFGEIVHAYDLRDQVGLAVTDTFQLKASHIGWGLIKKMTPTPVTGTLTNTITNTVPLLPNGKPRPGNSDHNKPNQGNPNKEPKPNSPLVNPNNQNSGMNPTAQAIASRYGAAYSTVMSWYNQGWSFNDIERALGLSIRSGVPAGQILTMRASGMSWGQIQQQLSGGAKPKKPPKRH